MFLVDHSNKPSITPILLRNIVNFARNIVNFIRNAASVLIAYFRFVKIGQWYILPGHSEENEEDISVPKM